MEAPLSWIVENLSDAPAEIFVQDRVLKPLGLTDTHFLIDDTTFSGIRQEIGVYFGDLPGSATPLLHDRTRSVAVDCSIALGGYTTMRNLQRWYGSVLRALRTDQQQQGMPSADSIRLMLTSSRGSRPDCALGRVCDFSGGFMVDLSGHSFGSLVSPHAFGHAGWLGTSWAFADPDFGLSGGFLLNGMPESMEDIDLVRRALMEALYRDLGASPR